MRIVSEQYRKKLPFYHSVPSLESLNARNKKIIYFVIFFKDFYFGSKICISRCHVFWFIWLRLIGADFRFTRGEPGGPEEARGWGGYIKVCRALNASGGSPVNLWLGSGERQQPRGREEPGAECQGRTRETLLRRIFQASVTRPRTPRGERD